jgi:predicted GNAT family acetyltransferase
MASAPEIRISDNPELHRYEAWIADDVRGYVDYHLQPGLITILHTEVDGAVEGQGVGSRLAAGALDDIRARGLSVLVVCPFVRAFIRRHPEYADLAAIG